MNNKEFDTSSFVTFGEDELKDCMNATQGRITGKKKPLTGLMVLSVTLPDPKQKMKVVGKDFYLPLLVWLVFLPAKLSGWLLSQCR